MRKQRAWEKWRAKKRAEGKCVNCGKGKDRVDRTRCAGCRAKYCEKYHAFKGV